MPIRPKRFVDETCPRCRRDEWKHEVSYQLLTEDEFEAMMRQPMDTIPGLPAGFEPLWVGAGGTIGGAIEEAAAYCKEYGRKGVGFDFNGHAVFVTAESDIDAVYRDWWKRMYHETPEESFAKR